MIKKRLYIDTQYTDKTVRYQVVCCNYCDVGYFDSIDNEMAMFVKHVSKVSPQAVCYDIEELPTKAVEMLPRDTMFKET